MILKNAFCRRVISLVLVDVLTLFGAIQGIDDCRTLEFKPSIVGRSLFNHVIEIHLSTSRHDCQLKCYLEAECMSINFGPGNSGTFLCELSNSDHNLHPEDLMQRDGFIYVPTENFCASNPCYSNGRCQTGFTDKGYRCICSVGFTGEDCSIEIPMGQIPAKPGDSCKHVLESGASSGDGEYWLDPEQSGNPLKVYCDMTTDGGGWVLVAKAVTDSSTPPSDWTDNSKISNSYRTISDHHYNAMRISQSAMNELRTYLNYTQLRFHCSKELGRTFHVTTVANNTGEAVVQYFSGQTDEMPSSCNSFQRLEGDSSQLALQCDQWGTNGAQSYVGKWGHFEYSGQHKMYNHAAHIQDRHHWRISGANWLCDDYKDAQWIPLSPGDFWKVYVR